MENAGQNKHGFCMLSTFERSKHPDRFVSIEILIIHTSTQSPLSQENSTKTTIFPTKHNFLLIKVFDMYLLLGLSSLLVKIVALLWKNWYLIVVPLKHWLKTCLTALVWGFPTFSKKTKFSKWPKSHENRTSMGTILLFLAKPLDKLGITLVHICSW